MNIFLIILLSCLFFILGAALMKIHHLIHKNRKLERDFNSTSTLPTTPSIVSSKESNQHTMISESALNHQLNEIKKKLDEIYNLIYVPKNLDSNKTADTVSEDSQTKKKVEFKENKAKDKQLVKLFFRIPESDGSFINSNQLQAFTEGEAFYYIEKENEKSNYGLLFYLTNSRDIKAMNRSQRYLNPVCDIENPDYRLEAKSIQTVKPGTVYLSEGNWTIKDHNKVLVRYE